VGEEPEYFPSDHAGDVGTAITDGGGVGICAGCPYMAVANLVARSIMLVFPSVGPFEVVR